MESSRKAAACIQENLKFTRLASDGEVLVMDVFRALDLLAVRGESFSVIFMDPPYNRDLEKVLSRLKDSPLVTEETLLIVEASLERFLLSGEFGYEVLREKNTRQMSICFLQRAKGAEYMRRTVNPGSFDPVTFGHLDIIEDPPLWWMSLVVGVLNTPAKTPLFSVEERVNILLEATKDIPNVRVESFSGLSVDFAKNCGARFIVRGLRAITDFDYELQLAQTNRIMNAEVDTLFLATSLEYAYLSSSTVKEVASYGGDVSKFVPPFVVDKIYNKIWSKKNQK